MNGSDQNGPDVSSCQTIGYSATTLVNPSSTQYHKSVYTSKSGYGQNSDNPPENISSTQFEYIPPAGYTSEPDYTQTPSEPQYSSTPEYTQKSSYSNSVFSPGYYSYSSQKSGYNSGDYVDYSGYPTPTEKYHVYQPSTNSYHESPSEYPSDSVSSYDHVYASPTTLSYGDQPRTYHPNSPAEYDSATVYTLPLPTTYSGYPSGCSYVCAGQPSKSGYPSDIPGYSSQPQDNGVDPGLYSPTRGSTPSYQPGDSTHLVYPTEPVGPQRPAYSPNPGKSSNPGTSSNPGRPSSKFTAVVGAHPKIIERRSIQILQRDHSDVFNMLLLALESLQSRAESDDLSYYQLSGKIRVFIH